MILGASSCKEKDKGKGQGGSPGNSGGGGGVVVDNTLVTMSGNIAGFYSNQLCKIVNSSNGEQAKLILTDGNNEAEGSLVNSGSQSCIDISGIAETNGMMVGAYVVNTSGKESVVYEGSVTIDRTDPIVSSSNTSSTSGLPNHLGNANYILLGSVFDVVASDSLSGLDSSSRTCTFNSASTSKTDLKTCEVDICDNAGNCVNQTSQSYYVRPKFWNLLSDLASTYQIPYSEIVHNGNMTYFITKTAGGSYYFSAWDRSSTNPPTHFSIGNTAPPKKIYIYNSEPYFVGFSGSTAVIYKYNGASLVRPFGALGSWSGAGEVINAATVHSGNLMLSITNTSTSVSKLFEWNGTTLTKPLGNNGSSGATGSSDDIQDMISFNSKLYFYGYSTDGNKKLLTWDGVTLEEPLTDNGSYLSASNPAFTKGFIVKDSNLYLFGAFPYGLYLYNEAGTSVTRLNTLNSRQKSGDAVVFQNNIYFNLQNSASDVPKLHMWNGTTLSQPLGNNGTCGNMSCTDNPEFLTVYNNALYFSSYNSSTGTRRKLYKWNGSLLTQPLGATGISGSATVSDELDNIAVIDDDLCMSGYVSSGENGLICQRL